MENLKDLEFWLIGYGLSIKDVNKIIKEIEKLKNKND
jgi:hypothetical protein